MRTAKREMQNAGSPFGPIILHFAFCILHFITLSCEDSYETNFNRS